MVLANIEAGYKEAESACVEKSGGPGMGSYVAEMTISRYNGDSFELYYVSYHDVENICLCVTNKSFFDEDFAGDEEILEMYNTIEDAQKSEYAKYFPVVKRMVEDMQSL